MITSAWRHYACDTTLALCSQRNNSKKRNDDEGGELDSAGTLAGTRSSSHGNHKQAIMASPAIWHDTPGQYIECTYKLTTTKSIKAKQQHSIK